MSVPELCKNTEHIQEAIRVLVNAMGGGVVYGTDQRYEGVWSNISSVMRWLI